MENDLCHWWQSIRPIDRRFEDGIEMCRGPAEGFMQIHRDGHIHGDYSLRNAFSKKKGALIGLLGDFGKTTFGKTSTLKYLGPPGLQAPEVDGVKEYTNKIDIYCFGMGLLEMFYLEVFTNSYFGYNPNAPQGRDWFQKVFRFLDTHLVDSDTHIAIIPLIQRMINPNPARRPTAADIVRMWPDYKARRVSRRSVDQQSTKRAKIDYLGDGVEIGM